jgi:F-type H+-transporting ATPase subunit b
MEVLHSLFEDLHIDPSVILVNIIGFLVLLALLRRLFFGPVGQFIEDRRKDVASVVAEAETAREQAQEELADTQTQRAAALAQAEADAEETRRRGQAQADELLNAARQQAFVRERRAEAHIREQQAEALAQARNQLTALSAALAERVLREGLKDEHQQGLLEAAVRDVEELARRERE